MLLCIILVFCAIIVSETTPIVYPLNYYGYPSYGYPNYMYPLINQYYPGYYASGYPWMISRQPQINGPGGTSNSQAISNQYGGLGGSQASATSLNLGGLFG